MKWEKNYKSLTSRLKGVIGILFYTRSERNFNHDVIERTQITWYVHSTEIFLLKGFGYFM